MDGQMLLPGERFCPMEDELLLHYLIPKVKGLQVPGGETLICDVDLYGDQEPSDIWNRYRQGRENNLRKDKDLHFFTKLQKAKGGRIARMVAKTGTWKAQTKPYRIHLRDGNENEISNPETVLGIKKIYTYRNEESPQDKLWILYQYELVESPFITKREILECKKRLAAANKNTVSLVLCVLKKNDALLERKRKNQGGNNNEEDEVDDQQHEMNPQHVSDDMQQGQKRLRGGFPAPCNANVPEVDQSFNQLYYYQPQQGQLREPYYNPSEPQQGHLGQQCDMTNYTNYYQSGAQPPQLEDHSLIVEEAQPIRTESPSGQESEMMMITTYPDNNIETGDNNVDQVYDDIVSNQRGEEDPFNASGGGSLYEQDMGSIFNWEDEGISFEELMNSCSLNGNDQMNDDSFPDTDNNKSDS